MTRRERLPVHTMLAVLLVIIGNVRAVSTALASSSVNTLTGVYSYDRIDASTMLNGAPVVFRRTYNSTDTRVTPSDLGGRTISRSMSLVPLRVRLTFWWWGHK